MEGNFAEVLYKESLQLAKLELGPSSTPNCKQSDPYGCDDDNDLWDGDGSLWHDSDEELDKSSYLEREWQRRQNQFHMIGYRDGLIAGKEASAQDGFNAGFKQSVLVGYNWGLFRGATRESLIGTQEKRSKIQSLHESFRSLSTVDALKMLHDDIMTKEMGQIENVEFSSHVADLHEQEPEHSSLGNYFEELQNILRNSPETKIHLTSKH